MRSGTLILAGLCLAFAGEVPSPVRARAADAPNPIEESADDRDVLLVLDDGPLHLRIHVELAGKSLVEARRAYVERLVKSLDTDGDGRLSQQEMSRSPLLTAKPTRGSDAPFLDASTKNRILSQREIEKSVERVGGEIVAYRQDSSAAKNDGEVFRFLDADSSGFLEPAEMVAAAQRILERDQDQDECISFEEFVPPAPPDPIESLVVRPGRTPRSTRVVSELLRDVSEPLLPTRLIKKYDKNRDNKLTAAELGWAPERLKMLDGNTDGKLDQRELAKIARTPVDLELAVDLSGQTDSQPALRILSTAGRRIDDAKRPDVVRIAFPTTVLTLSFKQVESIKASVASAMRVFNQLDADGNGYLDRKETDGAVRFKEGGLFDALDTDGDSKIFGEEMEKYVAARGEPSATSAHIVIYDTGRGFFETLDRNGDGRISMREMRMSDKSLRSMTRNGGEKLGPGDPVRNFHIEFERGIYYLFRPEDQLVSDSPSFEQRVPVGPIWFQRMDRNNDGDLTWNEFLGPRDVFHRIDKDGDGLIDPDEAAEVTDDE